MDFNYQFLHLSRNIFVLNIHSINILYYKQKTHNTPTALHVLSFLFSIAYCSAASSVVVVCSTGVLEIPRTLLYSLLAMKAQTKQSLLNASAILREAGLGLGNVVKTTVFLADMGDFAAMNEVYSEFFSAPFPARSAVAVKALPKGALVEIECIAAK